MKTAYQTLVIGTGCAGYNAADWLYDFGHTDIAIVTEGVNMGTSRNTGSDKQTYYKLSLASDGADSVREMAQTLFAGGAVHGDTALCEAACSVRSFMKLANKGVPFPTNIYGEYVGYKTDHDPRQRATSCGPLTSKIMTEKLQASVEAKGIEVLDRLQVTEIMTCDNCVTGVMAINTLTGQTAHIACNQVILATGGPAGVYWNSVFPESQTGATGLAIRAGAACCNLQEWQYGLASTDFRWNVSGTYQQVLPRFISVAPDGTQREFLAEAYPTPIAALDMVFLKGYQWPFDTMKIEGSSRVDMLVHEETLRGNKVYMDFRTNPAGLENGFDGLSEEAHTYLAKSNALFGTPIQRLAHMNQKAIDLYMDHGIDLTKEPLAVAVCAQHCNGGVAVDANWQTNVTGLYVVGEAAGTFGVYRPGGSALNASQVGSLRAAEHIAFNCQPREFTTAPVGAIVPDRPPLDPTATPLEPRFAAQQAMSRCAAYIRDLPAMQALRDQLAATLPGVLIAPIDAPADAAILHKNHDLLVTQLAVLDAMIFSAQHIGTRGAGLVVDGQDGRQSHWNEVITTDATGSRFTPIRPMPELDDWFENVWNAYNQRMNLA